MCLLSGPGVQEDLCILGKVGFPFFLSLICYSGFWTRLEALPNSCQSHSHGKYSSRSPSHSHGKHCPIPPTLEQCSRLGICVGTRSPIWAPGLWVLVALRFLVVKTLGLVCGTLGKHCICTSCSPFPQPPSVASQHLLAPCLLTACGVPLAFQPSAT